MQTQREQYLLFRIREFRDERAFDELHRTHSASVKRYLVLKLPKTEDAEDALSTTFLRVWNYLLTTRVESASGLMFTIARSVVAEFYRTRQETVQVEGMEAESRQDVQAEAELALVDRVIDDLKPEEQDLIRWKHFDGLSLREIAHRTGHSEATVGVLLHRAMKKLRANLASNT